MAQSFQVAVDSTRAVTALFYPSEGTPLDLTVILAHGAGGDQHQDFIVRFSRGLSARGMNVVSFNFLYAEQRRRAPDQMPLLEACYLSVIDAVRARADLDPADLVIGGKSMGGRVASHIAARGDRPVSGVVLLGYPLHPPGKPAQWRTAHLPRIHVPMLFLQGTRDPFGTPDELKSVLATVPHVTLVPVEGGDHSFKVPRSSGTSQADVFATMLDRIAGWMEGTRHARL